MKLAAYVTIFNVIVVACLLILYIWTDILSHVNMELFIKIIASLVIINVVALVIGAVRREYIETSKQKEENYLS
jgi:ACR3 family arsenite efflux pump ArsB